MSTAGTQRALVVDCDAEIATTLSGIVDGAGYSVVGLTQFEAARRQVTSTALQVLITNMRLAEFNGVHLAYLAKATNAQALEMNFKGIFLDEGRRILQ